MEEESLLQEVKAHEEKHRNTHQRIETTINRCIELYEEAERTIRQGHPHQQAVKQVNEQLLALRPLKTVREHFLHYYRKLSSLMRRAQNNCKASNPGASRHSRRRQSNSNKEPAGSSRFKQYFGSFISQQSQKEALERMIVEHFVREGHFEAAKACAQNQRDPDPGNLFAECHRIAERVRKGCFEEAILWCENEHIFETRESLLGLQLVRASILSLVRDGKPREGLQMFSLKVPRYLPHCQVQVEQLMGAILFGSHLAQAIGQDPGLNTYCRERYGEMGRNQEELAEMFCRQYLRHNHISQFDVLRIVYECSRKVNEEYQRLLELTWGNQSNPEHQKKHEGQLPFSIQLQNDYQYHSLFLCPVTKEVHSSGDQSVLLSCGHMISQPAQDRIVQESRNRRRVKCPICQKEIHPEDSTSVQF